MKILINKKTKELLIGSYWYEVLANPALQPLIEVAEVEAEDSSIDESKIADFKNWKTTFDVETNGLIYEKIIIDQLPIVRQKKLSELQAYDSSPSVNSFTINGIEMWLDKATRTSLTTLANACQKLGQEKMQLQIKEGVFVELPTEQVLQILAMIELYAGQCYIVTQQHNVAISKLETITEIEVYDFEKGYPKKLAF